MMKWTRVVLVLLWTALTAGSVFAGSDAPVSQSVTETPGIVHSLNISGTETRLLPANIDIWSCDWSPNNKSLVFAGKMQGQPGTKLRIWHWEINPTQNPVVITNTDGMIDYSPRWAPDGKKIALVRRAYTNANHVKSSIWVKEIPGGAGRQLTNGSNDRDPAWSPDGNKIVFSRGEGPYQAGLAVVNVSNGTVTPLIGNAKELLQSPWWGSDGRIYFTKLTPALKNITANGGTYQVMDLGLGSIWAINPENQRVEKIVADQYDNRLPVLSPDGTRLAFVSNRSVSSEGNGKFDRGSLFIKDMRSGDIMYVTNKVGLNGGSLSWSSDGKKIAFFTFRSIRPAVWVISIP